MSGIAAFARRYRRRLIALGAILAGLAAIAVALPFAVRYELAEWLREGGMRTASVERVVIDYFEPSLEIVGLQVEDKDGKVLHFARIAVALDVGALWHRRVHLRSLVLEGGTVELIQDDLGAIRVAGIPAAPASSTEPSEAPPWLVGVDSTAVVSLNVRAHTPDGSQEFTIENARLGPLAMWADEAPTALELAVAAGNGTLNAGGQATPFGRAPSFAVDLNVKAFDLSRVGLFRDAAGLAGVFSGRLKVRVESPTAQGPEIHIDGTASVVGLKLIGRPGAPSLGTFDWTGEARLGTGANGALGARIQGKLAAETLATETMRFGAATFSDLDARITYEATKGVEADVSGTLSVAGPDLDIGGAGGKAERLQWKGGLHAATSPADGIRIEAKGDFEAQAATYATQAVSLIERSELSVARFSVAELDAKVQQSPDGSVRLDLSGKFGATDAKGSAAGDSFAEDSASWSGTIGASSAPGKPAEIALDGGFEGKGLMLDLKSVGWRLAQDSLDWRGTAKVGGDASTLSATVRALGTKVDAIQNDTRVLDIGRLSLNEAALDAAGLFTVRRLEVEALNAFRMEGPKDPSNALANFGTLAADSVAFGPGERIVARRIQVGDTDIRLELDEGGRLRTAGILAMFRARTTEPGASSGMPQLVLGEVTVGGKSEIHFVDRSVDPPAKIGFGPITLRLGELDSAKPDRPVPIKLSANVGSYAKLDLDGNAKPFAPRINVDLQGKLTGFDLASLSGYLSQHLGYDLSRGRLDTDMHIKIVDDTLDSTSRLAITNLTVAQGKSDASRALQRNLEISLDTALSLLRNSDDVIELNVPVTGDIASPNFDLSDAINIAIGNAMKRTLTAMLTVAFPVGGLIMAIVDSTGDKALMFKPVAFEGGEVNLDDAAKEYLDTLGKLLEARPSIRLTVCGVSTQRDAADIFRVRQEKAAAETRRLAQAGRGPPKPEEAAPVTRDELYDLSQRRSVAVKDYLIARPGVAETRVFVCAPNVADDPAAAPHAEITL